MHNKLNLSYYFPTKTLSMYLRAGSGRSLAMCHVVLGGFNTRFTLKGICTFYFNMRDKWQAERGHQYGQVISTRTSVSVCSAGESPFCAS